MTPDLRIDLEPALLAARFSGSLDVPFLLGKVDSIIKECETRKLDLLLVDLQGLESGPLSTFDRYRMGTSILAALGKVEKVACVLAPELLDSERFGERVAQNRGLNLRVFTQEKAARAWLFGEKSP